MKLLLALVTLASSSAFASQTINCREVTDAGTFKKDGIEISLKLDNKNSGIAIVKPLKTERMDLTVQKVTKVREFMRLNDEEATLIYLDPKDECIEADIQLRFKAFVIGKNFKNLNAIYRFASMTQHEPYSYSFNFNVICNGKTY